ncbi:MAG: HD domain-containing protein [Desulfobacterales bacterium]|jgi:dGTPase|nr:HD domain-containing protein [Desulfobacterales bacterium]
MARYNADDSFDKLRSILGRRESQELSSTATLSIQGVRRRPEKLLENDYRQNYAVDVDRILNSLAYTRYIDKTQVFYLIENDHITHRMLHVQLVSKVARTIGRYLSLNEDLIEAIAIGHDIGHPPFGHDGERILSTICRRHGIGEFHHNVQSVQFLEKVERKGKGWNLCLQTLDGILCHDGEIHNQKLSLNQGKAFDDHESEIKLKKSGSRRGLVPMTLEGCVVRFADTVSYIGRDIEDAIRLHLIERSDLPGESVRHLGETNGTIVYSLVTDIIFNSIEKPYIAFSPEISDALKLLKQFNYERIYMNPAIKKNLGAIKELFAEIFSLFRSDIHNRNLDSPIYKHFIDGMSEAYLDSHCPEEIVRDFVAGMTDKYFLRQSSDSKFY